MRRAAPRCALAFAFAGALAGCGKSATPSASLATTASGAAGDAGEVVIPGTAEAWQAAASLAPEDLGHLALREGSAGLVAGATTPERRRVAVHALAFGEDLEALPFLAEVAAGPDADLALAAASSAAELAARPRRSVDPEDALEVRDGCDRMTALVKDKAKPKTLRVRLLRVVRMLDDRGCARDVPPAFAVE